MRGAREQVVRGCALVRRDEEAGGEEDLGGSNGLWLWWESVKGAQGTARAGGVSGRTQVEALGVGL